MHDWWLVKRNSSSHWIALASVLAVGYLLLHHISYTQGYGNVPVSFSKSIWGLWTNFDDWSHGMFVPLISLALVWKDRARLAKIPIRGENWALAPLILSFATFWLGFKADQIYLGYVAIMLFTASATLWLLGWKMFQAVMFPWAFLLFTWPLLFLESIIAFPLRLFMAEVSYRFLDLIGLDVIKQGSGILSAPDFARGIEPGAKFQVDIANPCSGIRSLFALMMITCIYGHLFLTRWWTRWTIFALALPLAVLGNFFRILMLTFGTLWFGSKFAIGESLSNPSTYHMASGFAVFGVALLAMVTISAWLRRMEAPEAVPPDAPASMSKPNPAP